MRSMSNNITRHKTMREMILTKEGQYTVFLIHSISFNAHAHTSVSNSVYNN